MFMFRLPAKLLCRRMIYAVCLLLLLASRDANLRHLKEAIVSLLSVEKVAFYKSHMMLLVVCVESMTWTQVAKNGLFH